MKIYRVLFGVIQVVFVLVLLVASSVAGILPFIAILLFWIGVTLVFGFMALISAVQMIPAR